jgi:hypothetical protein
MSSRRIVGHAVGYPEVPAGIPEIMGLTTYSPTKNGLAPLCGYYGYIGVPTLFHHTVDLITIAVLITTN